MTTASMVKDNREKGASAPKGPFTNPTELAQAMVDVVVDPVGFAKRYGLTLNARRHEEERRVALNFSFKDGAGKVQWLTPERIFGIRPGEGRNGKEVDLVAHQVRYVDRASARTSWRGVKAHKEPALFVYNLVMAVLHGNYEPLKGRWSGMSWQLVGIEVRIEQGTSTHYLSRGDVGQSLNKVSQLQNKAMQELEPKKYRGGDAEAVREDDTVIELDLVYVETTGARPRRSTERDEEGRAWQESEGSYEAMPEATRDAYNKARPVVEFAFENLAPEAALKFRAAELKKAAESAAKES